MKKTILLAAFAVFGLANAQESSIKVNPFSAFVGGADMLSYERKLGDNSSAVIGAGYGNFTLSSTKYKNFAFGAQYRYYFNEAIKGFYAAGTAEYINGKTETDNIAQATAIKYGGFSVGGRAGYQWIFKSGFTVDLNLGLGYDNYNYKYASASEEALYVGVLKTNGVLFKGALGLGYSF